MTSMTSNSTYDSADLKKYISTFVDQSANFAEKAIADYQVGKYEFAGRILDISVLSMILTVPNSRSFDLPAGYNYLIPLLCVALATTVNARTVFMKSTSLKNHCHDADEAARFINDMKLFKDNELLAEDKSMLHEALQIAQLRQRISERNKSSIFKNIGTHVLNGLCSIFFGTAVVTNAFNYAFTSKVIKLSCFVNLSNSALDTTIGDNARDALHLQNITRYFKNHFNHMNR